MQLTANLLGATGLVGSHILELLLLDERFQTIRVFTRRPTGVTGSKLEEHVIDFEDMSSWESLVTGDVLFSTLGTTLEQAGSKEAQYVVDHTYQNRFARAASRNGVPRYVLCSSAGATAGSWIFYLRMKGELERDVRALDFQHISIVRPGQIIGDRREARAGEQFLVRMVRAVTAINVFKKYQPVRAREIARAMIQCAVDPENTLATYTLNEVYDRAQQYRLIDSS